MRCGRAGQSTHLHGRDGFKAGGTPLKLHRQSRVNFNPLVFRQRTHGYRTRETMGSVKTCRAIHRTHGLDLRLFLLASAWRAKRVCRELRPHSGRAYMRPFFFKRIVFRIHIPIGSLRNHQSNGISSSAAKSNQKEPTGFPAGPLERRYWMAIRRTSGSAGLALGRVRERIPLS